MGHGNNSTKNCQYSALCWFGNQQLNIQRQPSPNRQRLPQHFAFYKFQDYLVGSCPEVPFPSFHLALDFFLKKLTISVSTRLGANIPCLMLLLLQTIHFTFLFALLAPFILDLCNSDNCITQLVLSCLDISANSTSLDYFNLVSGRFFWTKGRKQVHSLPKYHQNGL